MPGLTQVVKDKVYTAANTVADAVYPSNPSKRAGAQFVKMGLSLLTSVSNGVWGIWSGLKTAYSFAKSGFNFGYAKFCDHKAQKAADEQTKKEWKDSSERALGTAWADLNGTFNNLKDTGYYAGVSTLYGMETAARAGITIAYGSQALIRAAGNQLMGAGEGAALEGAQQIKGYLDAKQDQMPLKIIPAQVKEKGVQDGVELADAPARPLVRLGSI